MKKMLIIIALVAIAATATADDRTFGDWVIEGATDIMTGEPEYYMVTEAKAASGTLRDPVLVGRYNDGELDLILHWGGYRVDRDARIITMVLGSDNAQTARISLSTTREAVFLNDETIGDMLGQETVAFEMQSATNRRMVARWDINGMVEALAYLTEFEQ